MLSDHSYFLFGNHISICSINQESQVRYSLLSFSVSLSLFHFFRLPAISRIKMAFKKAIEVRKNKNFVFSQRKYLAHSVDTHDST